MAAMPTGASPVHESWPPHQRMPLSGRRLATLKRRSVLASVLAGAVLVAAWAVVVFWAPEPWLWSWTTATHGFNYGLVIIGITTMFVAVLAKTMDDMDICNRNAARGGDPDPAGGVFWPAVVLGLLLSVPRWPLLGQAVSDNTGAPLAAHWSLILLTILPALVVGIVSSGALVWLEYSAYQLELAERRESAKAAVRFPSSDRDWWAVLGMDRLTE